MSEAWPDVSARGHTLPVGTHVGGVEITGLIGEGGFGIVYLAWDPSLQRRVALKEYMPASLASREADGPAVAVKSERHRETFETGLRSFVNEARLLARFDHPGLVKVYRFWEAHGTAYMMMPYYEGPTLKAALDRRNGPPDEAVLRGWLEPLLDALELIHAASCFHRDIAPDNILLTEHGPLLLDFGAARRVIGDMTQALTVVLKPGYAPVEQYGESARMPQGAWTDLYALGCVLHYAITGRAPMTSVERLMDDALQPLARVAAGRYSERFLAAIDALLAVRPHQRPQDVAQFRALLAPPEAAAAAAAVELADPPPELPIAVAGRRKPGAALVLGLCAAALAAGFVWKWSKPAGPSTPLPAPPVTRASAAPAKVVPAPASAAVFHETAIRPAASAAPGAPHADAAPAMNKPTTPIAARALPAAPHPATVRASAATAKPALSPRCSEILQKASLEALSAAETDFLKQECR